MERLDIVELANEADKNGIALGKNPTRTIRYYISIGLLQKPSIEQSGKKRISYFHVEHLYKLKLIDFYKKKGLSLREIGELLKNKIYWTKQGLAFIEQYRNEIPEDSFLADKPITNGEFAFFYNKFINKVKSGEMDFKFLFEVFANEKGGSLGEIEMIFTGGLLVGPKKDY